MPEQNKSKDPKEELEQAKIEGEEAIKEAETTAKEKVAKIKKEMFEKFGYEIHTHIKYDGKILEPGSYNKLTKVSKEQIARMLKRGDISK